MTAAPITVDANGAAHNRSGRFTHAWLYDTGPLPLLERPSRTELPAPTVPVVPAFPGAVGADVVGISYDGARTRVTVAADRCPHGSFARWAARNCRRCAGLR